MALFDRCSLATVRPALATSVALLCAAGAVAVPATAQAASSGAVGLGPVTVNPVTTAQNKALISSMPPALPLATTTPAPATTVTSAPATGSTVLQGSVVSVDGASFTIQRPGNAAGVVNEMTDYATALAAKDYPYVWGGGHAHAEIASVGSRGPGFNGRSRGFDCSGAVAAVLSAAGLWPKDGGVPNDAGVIRYLRARGLIASGPGTGPYEVTLYDDPGVHIFMNIDGRFFGTSDGLDGGDAKGGPGWLSDAAYDALNVKHFNRYHFLPSVLKDRASYLHDITFRYANGAQALEAAAALSKGIKVKVAYAQTNYGGLALDTISFPGAMTVSGTVTTVSASGAALTLTTAGGRRVTVDASLSALTLGVIDGDTVTVTYTRQGSKLTARAVTVIATPSLSRADGTVTRVGAGGSSLTLKTSSGKTLNLTVGPTVSASRVKAGETIDVTYYSTSDGALVLQSIQSIASAPPATSSPPASTGPVTGTGTVPGTSHTTPAPVPPPTPTTPAVSTSPVTSASPTPTSPPPFIITDRSGGSGAG